MRATVLAAMLALAATALAAECPDFPGAIPTTHAVGTPAARDLRMPEGRVVPTPPWTPLERMGESERANSCIELELPADANPQARAVAAEIADLWNRGRYDEALAAFRGIGEFIDPNAVAVGNKWRSPVPTYSSCLWGDDVRIGNRDSITQVSFDIHRGSGNLFAILVYKEGARYNWSVNFSTNDGAAWHETYYWWTTYHMSAVDAAVLADYCYVVYDGGASPNREARVRGFSSSTGDTVRFSNGNLYVTAYTTAASDSIKELALVSSADEGRNRIYCAALLHSGAVKYLWDDSLAVSWDTGYSTGVSDGANGLDICYNEGAESSFVWISFFDQSDNARIIGRRGAGFRNFLTRAAGAGGEYTSIGAYHDTILCAFDYEARDPNVVRYETNYEGGNPGSQWRYGYAAWDTTTLSESPDVALRKGGGEGFIYRYYSPTRELRYIWRNYAGNWSTPVAIADHEPFYNRPAIEYLGSAYGVAYIRWSDSSAYFDRTDWTGVAEQRRMVVDENILNVTPNPLRGTGRLNYTLNRPAALNVQVFDRTGRVVRTLFNGRGEAGRHSLGFSAEGMAPGVYFVRADADGSTLTVPVTVVK